MPEVDPAVVEGSKRLGSVVYNGIAAQYGISRAIGDGSINSADISFWDTLPVQETLPPRND